MDKVKTIADNIDPSLKVTTDFTCNHEDGRLPVLDLKVWIGKDRNDEIKILYSHYMKDVASRMTIHYRSSHSITMKKNVMVNELSRIFRNCSSGLTWEEVAKHVSYFTRRMQFSEYPEEVRREVVSDAIKRYDAKMKRKDNTVLNRELQQTDKKDQQ